MKNPLLEESKNFELGRIVKRPAKQTTKKSQAIIVYVSGGVVQDVEKPKKYADVAIEIHDYDVDDDDRDNIAIDKDGKSFARSRY
jgi:hypothetical protein